VKAVVNPVDTEQSARCATLILKRWVHDQVSPTAAPENKKDLMILQELFHRVMNLWQRSKAAPDRAIQLLQVFQDASDMTGSRILCPGPRPYSMIFETLHRTAADPATTRIAEKLMQQMMQTASPRDPSLRVAQNSYLHLLSKCSRSLRSRSASLSSSVCADAPEEKAERFLRNVMIRPEGQNFAAVLQAWTHQPFHACKLLETMIEKGMIDRLCFNICIQALGYGGHGQAAEDLLWRLNELFIESGDPEARPDCYSFLGAINGWSKSDNPERAAEVLRRMLTLQQHDVRYRDLRPITANFTAVMDAFARRPGSGARVEDLLDHMEDLYTKGCVDARPSRQSYCIAIRAWGRTDQLDAPDRATDVLRRMEALCDAGRRDLAPDTVAYTSLIQAWAQSRRVEGPERALTILRYMMEKTPDSPAPNSLTLNSVLNAFARRGMATQAHSLLREMVSRHNTSGKDDEHSQMRPNNICWATVIHAYKLSDRRDAGARADELLLELEHMYDKSGEEADKPTPAIYASVITAHGPNDTMGAEAILWRMVDRYRASLANPQKNAVDPPNTFVCNALLRVWSLSDDPVAPQRAEAILRWMEGQVELENEQHLSPDTNSFHHLLETWARSNRRNALDHMNSICLEIKSKYPHLVRDGRLRKLLEELNQSLD